MRSRLPRRDGLAQLAGAAPAITTEFENVPAAALRRLARRRPVAPARRRRWRSARTAPREKAHFVALRRAVRAACGDRRRGATLAARAPTTLLPGILKTARLGYDGKGQARVADARRARRRLARARQRALRAREAAAARRRDERDRRARRATATMRAPAGAAEPAPRRHPRRDAGAGARRRRRRCSSSAVDAARAHRRGARTTSACCASSSSCCDDGSLVANEMAPRPHNRGHYSIDACDVSQFELQVRALAGLPLRRRASTRPAVMLNLLGDLWFATASRERAPPWARRAGAARRAPAPVRQGRGAAAAARWAT